MGCLLPIYSKIMFRCFFPYKNQLRVNMGGHYGKGIGWRRNMLLYNQFFFLRNDFASIIGLADGVFCSLVVEVEYTFD